MCFWRTGSTAGPLPSTDLSGFLAVDILLRFKVYSRSRGLGLRQINLVKHRRDARCEAGNEISVKDHARYLTFTALSANMPRGTRPKDYPHQTASA